MSASLEQRLANLDLRIQAARDELDRLYERGASNAKKQSAWERLERAAGERDYLLWQWSIRESLPDWELFARAINHAFAEFARRVVEATQPHLAAFSRLSEAAGLCSHKAIQRLMREDEASRKPGPHQIFAPAAVGIGPLGLSEFRRAKPTNLRPVLPGFMQQKGRG